MRGYAKRHAPELSSHFEKLQFPILFNLKGKSDPHGWGKCRERPWMAGATALRLAAQISRKEE